jgi:hypothetical protein
VVRSHLDAGLETLGREGSFTGRRVGVPLRGVAKQIKAFNPPVWDMLAKLLAGVPTIVKSATATGDINAAIPGDSSKAVCCPRPRRSMCGTGSTPRWRPPVSAR